MDSIARNKRVILGLSGGVDSAVAALRLLESGAAVEALHMTNWEDDAEYCSAARDLQDARHVCDQLGIVLHHVNFARQYRERVFRYFLAEYERGRTPNPDVLCNREIKFGAFHEHARRLGADFIATGHYARRGTCEGRPALFRGRDPNKDQSYFLHAVDAAALAGTLFPVGGLGKDEVRRIARRNGLAVAAKKDSTGICFIGERPFREFLARYLPARPGPIRRPDGTEIGRHEGLMYYTLGQRQGLGIGGRQDASDSPWYVVDKRVADNALIVDQGDTPLLMSRGLVAAAPTWIGGPPPGLGAGVRLAAQVRYRQAGQSCRVRAADGGRLVVEFDMPQRAVAPGQFVVFYAGERCLGGAVIERTLRPGDADALPAGQQRRRPSAIMRDPAAVAP